KKRTHQTPAVEAREAGNSITVGNSSRLSATDETDDSSEFDDIDPDDQRWDAFIADDDERDPQPELGDFSPLD
ncbi:MAG TPA: hypothetical protein VHU84_17900, partial [Lacipirellulaceae bacterium]|nr:hypothetical protein [Lacipirellulaceae bacterium]